MTGTDKHANAHAQSTVPRIWKKLIPYLISSCFPPTFVCLWVFSPFPVSDRENQSPLPTHTPFLLAVRCKHLLLPTVDLMYLLPLDHLLLRLNAFWDNCCDIAILLFWRFPTSKRLESFVFVSVNRMGSSRSFWMKMGYLL